MSFVEDIAVTIQAAVEQVIENEVAKRVEARSPSTSPLAGTVQSGNEQAATPALTADSGTPEQGNSEQQPKEGANAPASPSEVPAGEGYPGAAT